MSLLAELKQIFYDLQIAGEPGRDVIAHFCEHDGIRVRYRRARTTWHSLGPSAIRPWWMILEPLKTLTAATGRSAGKDVVNNKKALEVTEHA